TEGLLLPDSWRQDNARNPPYRYGREVWCQPLYSSSGDEIVNAKRLAGTLCCLWQAWCLSLTMDSLQRAIHPTPACLHTTWRQAFALPHPPGTSPQGFLPESGDDFRDNTFRTC